MKALKKIGLALVAIFMIASYANADTVSAAHGEYQFFIPLESVVGNFGFGSTKPKLKFFVDPKFVNKPFSIATIRKDDRGYYVTYRAANKDGKSFTDITLGFALDSSDKTTCFGYAKGVSNGKIEFERGMPSAQNDPYGFGEFCGFLSEVVPAIFDIQKMKATLATEAAAALNKTLATAPVAPEKDFTVKLNEAGDGVIITAYNGKAESLTIPATIQGLPVKEVNVGFNIKRVDFPDSVEKISGFGSEIIIVNLPKSLKEIPPSCFNGCKNLKSVTIPAGVESIGRSAFYECTLITNIVLPASLKIIPYGCFANCGNLKSVTIPNGVYEIGEGAFCVCESLENVTLPDSVSVIGKEAFLGCKSLRQVRFPSDLMVRIGAKAFQRSSIEELKITGNMKSADTGSWSPFADLDNLKTVTIAADVEELPKEFISSKTLEKIVFESADTAIEENTFSNCPNLSLATQAELRKHYKANNTAYQAKAAEREAALLAEAEDEILAYVQNRGSVQSVGDVRIDRKYDSVKRKAFDNVADSGKLVYVENNSKRGGVRGFVTAEKAAEMQKEEQVKETAKQAEAAAEQERATLPKRMLQFVSGHKASYADIMSELSTETLSQMYVGDCLSKLERQGLVETKKGVYVITKKGKEELKK